MARKTLSFGCDPVRRGSTPWRRQLCHQQMARSLCLAPTCQGPPCLAWPVRWSFFILSYPWFSCPAEADGPEVSIRHLCCPRGPGASLRLTVFSNPEQAQRCGQGREAPHPPGSQGPWQGGAPGTRQPPGPPGLCRPSARGWPHRLHCLRSPAAPAAPLAAAQLWLVWNVALALANLPAPGG